jgi:hypothetical protein
VKTLKPEGLWETHRGDCAKSPRSSAFLRISLRLETLLDAAAYSHAPNGHKENFTALSLRRFGPLFWQERFEVEGIDSMPVA